MSLGLKLCIASIILGAIAPVVINIPAPANWEAFIDALGSAFGVIAVALGNLAYSPLLQKKSGSGTVKVPEPEADALVAVATSAAGAKVDADATRIAPVVPVVPPSSPTPPVVPPPAA